MCLMVLCLFLTTELVLFCSLDAMFATENTLFAPAIHHIPKQERMSILSCPASGKSATHLSPIDWSITHLYQGHAPNDFFL